jgi:hypothetical protein
MDAQDSVFRIALARLRGLMESEDRKTGDFLGRSDQEKHEVLARFQPLFASENVANLEAQDFNDFLLFKHNKHWSSLQRTGSSISANIAKLREALQLLVDENQTLPSRLNKLVPKKDGPMVPHLNRAILTAILQVEYPDKFGVLNGTTEGAMKRLGVWPEFESKESFGQRYDRINEILLSFSRDLKIDLWTLDTLWSLLLQSERTDPSSTSDDHGAEETGDTECSFGLEKHLQDFLVDNWDSTDLGKDWQLFKEDEEIVGSAYKTGEVGEIDLLAKHKTKQKWLVIELKRGQTSDATVGQVLRYMGWVSKELAASGDTVEGLIISRIPDKRLSYALTQLGNVKQMLYQVSFALRPANEKAAGEDLQ